MFRSLRSPKTYTFLLAAFITAVTYKALAEDPPPEMRVLMVKDTVSLEESFVGVMADGKTCSSVAKALNVYAEAPPVTPVKFFCAVVPSKEKA